MNRIIVDAFRLKFQKVPKIQHSGPIPPVAKSRKSIWACCANIADKSRHQKEIMSPDEEYSKRKKREEIACAIFYKTTAQIRSTHTHTHPHTHTRGRKYIGEAQLISDIVQETRSQFVLWIPSLLNSIWFSRAIKAADYVYAHLHNSRENPCTYAHGDMARYMCSIYNIFICVALRVTIKRWNIKVLRNFKMLARDFSNKSIFLLKSSGKRLREKENVDVNYEWMNHHLLGALGQHPPKCWPHYIVWKYNN